MNEQHVKTDEELKFKLKPLSKDGIEGALKKAEQYRLLNQPQFAESICLDILGADPQNQNASIILLLSLTDQFGKSSSNAAKQSMQIAKSLKDEYSRLYYTGIIYERQGSAALNSRTMGSDYDAYEWYLEAMELFEKADAIRRSDNDDAVLRWNTCARIIMHQNLKERPADDSFPALEE